MNGDFKPPSDNNFPTGFGLGNTSPQSTTPSLSDNVEKDVENLLQRMQNVDEHLQIIHEILQIGQDGRNGTYISQVIRHLEERIDHLLSPSAPPAPNRGSPQGGQGNTNTPIPVGGLGSSDAQDLLNVDATHDAIFTNVNNVMKVYIPRNQESDDTKFYIITFKDHPQGRANKGLEIKSIEIGALASVNNAYRVDTMALKALKNNDVYEKFAKDGGQFYEPEEY